MKTISLPLAKQLYKLGVRGKSHACWLFNAADKWVVVCKDKIEIQDADGDGWIFGEEVFPAYTLDELTDILPKTIIVTEYGGKREFMLEIDFEDGYVYYEGNVACSCHGESGYVKSIKIEDNNYTEAFGNLLAWVVEEGYCKGGVE